MDCSVSDNFISVVVLIGFTEHLLQIVQVIVWGNNDFEVFTFDFHALTCISYV